MQLPRRLLQGRAGIRLTTLEQNKTLARRTLRLRPRPKGRGRYDGTVIVEGLIEKRWRHKVV